MSFLSTPHLIAFNSLVDLICRDSRNGSQGFLSNCPKLFLCCVRTSIENLLFSL